MKNLYNILGVKQSATKETIRKAYKSRARILHPDKGGDNEAFQELQHAYAILYDENRRAKYDVTGDDGNVVDKDAEVRTHLAKTFLSMIQSERKGDAVQLVEQHVKIQILSGERNRDDAVSKKEILVKALDRVINTNKLKANLYHSALQQEIERIDKHIQSNDTFIAMGERMLEMLKTYEDTEPDEVEVEVRWTGGIGAHQPRMITIPTV